MQKATSEEAWGFPLQILIVQTEPNLKRLEGTKLRNEEKWVRRLASTGVHSHSTPHLEQWQE